MLTRYVTRAALLVAALLVTTACSDDEVAGPGEAELETVAMVELQGARPAFYVQKSDGSERTRIHFTGAIDEVPGNSPLVPDLTDDNILAIRSVKWSPDGTRLAFVATVAADQSEVVVMKADGTDARIVSVNYQYIVGDIDWSPDGTRLAYIMATLPSLRGLELFVSDVVGAPRVTKITTNSGYKGLGGTVRFASNGTAVWISQLTGEGAAPLFEKVSAVYRVELASGEIGVIKENIVGEVQAVAHNGAWALVLRHNSIANGVYDDRLLSVSVMATSPGERTIANGGSLDYARLTADDSRGLFLRGSETFTVFESFGDATRSVRGSGAEPLSADVKP